MSPSLGQTESRLAQRWLWIAATLTVLWVTATHLPEPERVGIRVGSHDRLAHAMGYFVMAAAWSFWWMPRNRRSPARCALLLWAVMLVFGATDEITQPLVGRAAQVGDWMADASGAAIALLVRLVWTSRQ